MGMLDGFKERIKRIRGMEWAVFFLVLGIAGSFLFAPGTEILAPAAKKDSVPPDALEARLSSVLSSMEGAGNVEVVIHYAKPAMQSASWLDASTESDSGEPIGALVLAEGAGNLQVRIELARAVQTLLRLDADAVEIFKMESAGQEE